MRQSSKNIKATLVFVRRCLRYRRQNFLEIVRKGLDKSKALIYNISSDRVSCRADCNSSRTFHEAFAGGDVKRGNLEVGQATARRSLYHGFIKSNT
jgi:hypothetical protein